MAHHILETPPAQEQRLKMSYEEFLAWADDIHAEWVNGEVIAFMPPNTIHQRITGFLFNLLSMYTHFFNLGEVIAAPFEMRVFPGRSSREPDLIFVAREHLARLAAERLEGPADLAIELISDSSVARDRHDKFDEYQEAGVGEYWIIDPRPGKERADFYQLTTEGEYQAVLPDADGRYHSLVVPGFWLNPDWMWQDPLPNPLVLLGTVAPQILQQALNPDVAGSST